MYDLDDFRDEVRESLGMDIVDLPTTRLDFFINRSYQWLLNAFKFRAKEVTVVFSTVAGIRNYDLPVNFESLRGVSILNSDTEQHTVLDRWTIDKYEQEYNEAETEWGFPTNYVREGNCIKLWKTPFAIYTVTLKYDRLLADLNDGNTLAEIPKNWDEFVLDGAIYRAYKWIGDYNRASAEKQQLHDDVAAAKVVEKKEEADSHRAGLDVYIPEYRV